MKNQKRRATEHNQLLCVTSVSLLISLLLWLYVVTGTEAAAKKWRCLNDFDSIRARMCLYCAARMLNQLLRGRRVWPVFQLKSGAAMAAPAAPMPPPLSDAAFT